MQIKTKREVFCFDFNSKKKATCVIILICTEFKSSASPLTWKSEIYKRWISNVRFFTNSNINLFEIQSVVVTKAKIPTVLTCREKSTLKLLLSRLKTAPLAFLTEKFWIWKYFNNMTISPYWEQYISLSRATISSVVMFPEMSSPKS